MDTAGRAMRAVIVVCTVAMAFAIPSTAAAGSPMVSARAGTVATISLTAPAGASQRFVRVVDIAGAGLEVSVTRGPRGEMTTRVRPIQVTPTGVVEFGGSSTDVTSRIGPQSPSGHGHGVSSILAIRSSNGLSVTTDGIEVTPAGLTVRVGGLRAAGAFRSWTGYTVSSGSTSYVVELPGSGHRANRAER